MADFNNIDVNIDTANAVIPPIRLHAGDVDGRTLRFIVTDDGAKIASTQYAVYSAELQWNGSPDDPNSAGGYASFSGYYTLEDTLAFVMPVPRALLQDTGSRALLTFVLKRTDEGDPTTNFTVCSRNIVALVEPSVLKASAPAIMDPLKELHDAVDSAKDAAAKAGQAVERANQVIDTAHITSGTTTTLKPNQPAASELAGSGLTRTLNLGLPRGASIASITATTAEGSTPTVATDKNADGDLTVSLGIPRGEKGDPGQPGQSGPKGDPGDASTIASSTVAGVVKIGSGLAITEDGTLSATAQPVPPATAKQMGIVRPGDGLQVESGVMKVRAGSGLNCKSSTGGVDLIVKPATTDSIGGVQVGSGLEVDSDGKLGVKTGGGLGFGTVGNGDFLRVKPATTDSIGGVQVGTGLSVDAQGVLSAASAGASVFLATSGDMNDPTDTAWNRLFARLVVSDALAPKFTLEFFGKIALSDSSANTIVVTFPDAITFSTFSVNAPMQYWRTTISFASVIVKTSGHEVSLTNLQLSMGGAQILSFPPLTVNNANAQANASVLADAADDATQAPAELSCTIDWSKL